MGEKRFEKDCDENVCSFDYSTMDTYYEYNVSNEEIIEWNKHSSNAQYRNLKHIAEILNIKQMRLESLMKHREEIGKLFDRIDEQQATIDKLDQENADLLGARIRAQEEWEKCTDKLKEKLLEQQATIQSLKEENGKLSEKNRRLIYHMNKEPKR